MISLNAPLVSMSLQRDRHSHQTGLTHIMKFFHRLPVVESRVFFPGLQRNRMQQILTSKGSGTAVTTADVEGT